MELIVVLVLALVVLGPKRLPAAGRSLGHGLREFKDSIAGKADDDELEVKHVTATVEHHSADVPTRVG